MIFVNSCYFTNKGVTLKVSLFPRWVFPTTASRREPDAEISLVNLPRGARGRFEGGDIMLLMIGVILVFLWLLGYASNVGGWFIHLVLVAAAIVFIVNFLSSRQTV